VADTVYNAEQIIEWISAAAAGGAKVIAFPECAVTAYTAQDLFLQPKLLRAAEAAVGRIAASTRDVDALVVVGCPVSCNNKLYNCAVVMSRGAVLGIVPKQYIPNYGEFYEARWFERGPKAVRPIDFAGEKNVAFGANQLFCCEEIPELVVGVEICEDLWVPNPPSTQAALAGATVIVNPSASDAVIGKARYRRELVATQSARLMAAYVYASSGPGESTQDLVFCAHDLIAENGKVLAEAKPFEGDRDPVIVFADVDVEFCAHERLRTTTYDAESAEEYVCTPFHIKGAAPTLERFVDPHPFVPSAKEERAERCEEILSIQAHGLAKRLAHTRCMHAVVGISGGLDSTLALLVTARAFDLLCIPHGNITAITMPGFGTTDRTYTNACTLVRDLDATLREISIAAAVRQHFADIGHDESVHDVTYENSQARERTQILMDVANAEGALVIGTGDLSELALGWATYNGDHMSMYGVNAGVPKTLVRHLVSYEADRTDNERLAATLRDVLDTPVSPELLPAEDGEISQKTEDLVGPYELHDFFLYNMLRNEFAPVKIYRLALKAFAGVYDAATIKKWLGTFYRRFFAQQFKRSCLPDGPKVGSVSVSPRGDLRMPSDAVATVWLNEIANL
jgi:NAD+ synthase (glutamine-hydrolysing)